MEIDEVYEVLVQKNTKISEKMYQQDGDQRVALISLTS